MTLSYVSPRSAFSFSAHSGFLFPLKENLIKEKEMLQEKISAAVLEKEHLQEELAKLKDPMHSGSSNSEVYHISAVKKTSTSYISG